MVIFLSIFSRKSSTSVINRQEQRTYTDRPGIQTYDVKKVPEYRCSSSVGGVCYYNHRSCGLLRNGINMVDH